MIVMFLMPAFGTAFAKDNKGEGLIKKEQNLIFPKIYSIHDDWIYYVSLYDNKIYKTKRDGSQKVLISDDSASDNGIIVSGEWIYYVSNSDGENFSKIKKDGTEKIEFGSIICDFGTEPFLMWRDNIYYYDADYLIHKININGEDADIISDIEMEIVSKLSLQSRIVEGWLYSWDYEGVSKTNVDSGEDIKITTDNVFSKFEVKDNWIYYINSEDSKLYKITVDGKNKTKLIDDNMVTIGPDYDMVSFHIVGDWIYYISSTKDNIKLYKVDVNGKNKSTLAEKAIEFTINEDCIYYIDEVDNGSLYSLTLDGSSTNKITSNSFIPYVSIEDGMIFYAVKSSTMDEPYIGRIFMINTDGSGELELK
jgi:hypothetical protein